MFCRVIQASLLGCLIMFGLGGCFARNGKLTFRDDGAAHYQRVASELEYPDVTAGKASQECTVPPLVLSLEHEPE